MLSVPPALSNICPCGQCKSIAINAIKIDASQFFKSYSTHHAFQRARRLLTTVTERTGYDAICVTRVSKTWGFFTKAIGNEYSFKKRAVGGLATDTFDNILRALKYALKDDLFSVGPHVLQRIRGHPMGGSFSEPATLVDLRGTYFPTSTDPRKNKPA